MKKVWILFVFFFNVAYGSANYELQLYEKVLPSIFLQTPLRIFVENKDIRVLLEKSDKFEVTNSCDSTVVVVIGKKFSQLTKECQDKPRFTTNYKSFINDSKSFGAFYWRKGRPQLRFKQDVLNRYNLKLLDGLEKYAR